MVTACYSYTLPSALTANELLMEKQGSSHYKALNTLFVSYLTVSPSMPPPSLHSQSSVDSWGVLAVFLKHFIHTHSFKNMFETKPGHVRI